MSGDLHADWIGRQVRREELLTRAHVDGLNALLDRGDALPLGLHWMLCQPRAAQSTLGPDGHPAKGDFLPPVALPRRMWAAADIAFHQPARPGQTVECVSTVAGVEEKTGRSGALVFVRVDHEFRADGIPWLNERHTIVYREAAASGAASAPPAVDVDGYPWRESITTDPVQLFRYSALTFNGHRIHYDHPYVTGVEGYPGLVVHGPLMATWLMNFAARRITPATLAGFRFRVLAPVFVGETVVLLGRETGDGLELAVVNGERRQVIEGTATTRPA